MLTLLGASIGAATINPMQEADPAAGLALGSAIWLIAASLISVFAGAYVAGRLSGGPRRTDGMLHGVVTWSVATVVMISTLASATGAVMGGVGTLIGGAMRTGAQQAQAQGQPSESAIESVRQAFPQAGEMLPPTGRTSGQIPGQLTDIARQDPEVAGALMRMEAQGGADAAQAERSQLVSLLVSKHGMQEQQAAGLVTQWDQQFQQMRAEAGQQARQTGEQVASGVAKGALWAFIALVLGLVVSAWGGRAGTASLPARYEETHTVPATP
jgi:hypothetical protein